MKLRIWLLFFIPLCCLQAQSLQQQIDLIIERLERLEKENQQLKQKVKELQGRPGEEKTLLPSKPSDFDDAVWNSAWNGEENWFDFTHTSWTNLPVTLQMQYSKQYQAWYAETLQTDVRKSFSFSGQTFTFVLIPPGKFWMGSQPSEYLRNVNETRHKVLIDKPFWMGETEVTQLQWQEIMNNNPSFCKGDTRLPVDSVSWDDSKKFCEKISCSLPTESQWEYACRAGLYTPFHEGENISTNTVNFHGTYPYRGSKGLYRGKTVPVGSLGNANVWGCYNFMGNLCEWCSDWYGLYTQKEQKNPSGPPSGNEKVLRGGSWAGMAKLGRSASRSNSSPKKTKKYNGLRITMPFTK